ncbi:hypothetical protein P153DRAFT_375810 [Dothidotthia symphoricarpi CBS 119687]|uniref:Sister chromatid cohesion protein-like protein Dcc1 n=1 Tax=Dothidotthia symphoricarpi CBS 119687 TaxID=1392245 RepID=A0A6A6AFW6_9PLEO|nr:uncharacterized protein P153DRAFT_375810 [Dothidotthia symphoricarpi CBS 119687]KAF2129301.1 hypothetical protein P153DRAFT_375810 [Dothidotthia symphoricarpi CBS 119687]
MATQQDEGGVPFSVAHALQHFRLLELPPDLAALIDAPRPPLLSIKSQAPAASGTPNPRPAYAVFCTPTTTFHLRQVQTSNVLFVTQPACEHHGNEIPTRATCAVASCTATLELYPSDASAVTLLQEALPVYDIVENDVDATPNAKTRDNIFEHIPLSEGQCVAAWRELMAFEHEGSSYRPSAYALNQVWRSINSAAFAEGFKLDSQYLVDDVSKAAAEEGHPPSLAEAILRHLAREDADANSSWSCLDRTKTVAFTGRILLEAKHGTSDFLIADFTDTWEDRLPEAWRKDAQLAAIEGVYEFPTNSTIKLKSHSATLPTIVNTVTAAKSSARKWHEKFGKTRKK